MALAAERRAQFWKLCGSGTGEGFTPRPNWGVWSLVAVWKDEAEARASVADSPLWARWQARASETFTVFLDPISSRGSWSGINPFLPDPTAPGSADPTGSEMPRLAVLTRASVRPSRMLRFWSRVPDISSRIGADPNVAFKIGIGEMPFLHQVTFSIWPDADSMTAFARGNGPHGQAIRAVREGQWFSEELYARFRVLGVDGTWEGTHPLSANRKEPSVMMDEPAP